MSDNKNNNDTKNKATDDKTNHVLCIDADPLSQFHMNKDELNLALIKAQYKLRETRQVGQPTGLLVLVNGMEMSGKGKAVTQLRQWVDPRLLNVEATVGVNPSYFEPIWQAHATKLPRHGNITVYFGNWYADLIIGALKRMNGDNGKSIDTNEPPEWILYLKKQIQVLSEFEADLSNNHTKLLKCWFHIDAETLKQRLTDKKEDPEWLYGIDWEDKQAVKNFNKVAKQLLSLQTDWVIFDGSMQGSESKDKGYNEETSVTFSHNVLHAVQEALLSSQDNDSVASISDSEPANAQVAFSWADVPDKLEEIDDTDIEKSEYKSALDEKQHRLAELLRARAQKLSSNKDSDESADGNNHHVIFVFEGMDAAGKGGAIKRLVAELDPREYQIYNIAAPTQRELQHPYLWRFWQRLPQFFPVLKEERLSRVAIFDRTWYGRVLVERIEGFATETAWQRAYNEINRMERDLSDKGTIIIKYWLAIDKQEQLERFEARENTPHKRFKLTQEDWRNRDKWHDYVQAAADMLARTNTSYAPWHVVATNDKRTARLAVLDHAIKQLEKVISV